jgi:multidrug resistance efflux pump
MEKTQTPAAMPAAMPTGRRPAEAKIGHLYDEWRRASAEEDRIQRLHDERRVSLEEVQRAREAADAAWQPYKKARAKAHAAKLRSSALAPGRKG